MDENNHLPIDPIVPIILIILLCVGLQIIPIRTKPVFEIEEWCENNECKLTLQCGGPFRWKRIFLSIDAFVEKLDELKPNEVFYSLCAGYTYFFFTESAMYGLHGVV